MKVTINKDGCTPLPRIVQPPLIKSNVSIMTHIAATIAPNFNAKTIATIEVDAYFNAIDDSTALNIGGALYGASVRILSFSFWLEELKASLSTKDFRQWLQNIGWNGEERKYLKAAIAFAGFDPRDLAQIEPRTIFRLAENLKKYQSVINQLPTLPQITQNAVNCLIQKCRKSRQTKKEEKPSIWRPTDSGRYCQIPPIHEVDEQTGTILQAMSIASGLSFQTIVREAVFVLHAVVNGRPIKVDELTTAQLCKSDATESKSSEYAENIYEEDFSLSNIATVANTDFSEDDYLLIECAQDAWTFKLDEICDDIEDYEFVNNKVFDEKLPVDLLIEKYQSARSWQEISEVLKTLGEYEQQAWEALTPLERKSVMSITPPEVIKLSDARKNGKIADFRELRENVYQVQHNGCLFWEIVYKSKIDIFMSQL
ncbi:hypothetical protein NIES4071_40610 [Calothrix sp. NIES-4071]|nr:hypothetical protein NIES4071_40610 [Calothrix sp. NIES-4071]BAZ58377.1 hypothetical protein NIES4105_40550 [Calothrix sp. NIES-4105]